MISFRSLSTKKLGSIFDTMLIFMCAAVSEKKDTEELNGCIDTVLLAQFKKEFGSKAGNQFAEFRQCISLYVEVHLRCRSFACDPAIHPHFLLNLNNLHALKLCIFALQCTPGMLPGLHSFQLNYVHRARMHFRSYLHTECA